MKIDIAGWQGFTAADFCLEEVPTPQHIVFFTLSEGSRQALAERANQILAEKLAGAPRVYACETIHGAWQEHRQYLDTHTARLVCIKPLEGE